MKAVKDLKFKTIIRSILLYLPLIFVFSLPVSQKISTLCLPIWLCFTLLNIRNIRIKINYGHVVPVIYYIFLMGSFLYSDKVLTRYFEYRLPLLVIPILVILNGDQLFPIRTKILKSFVLGCIVAATICFGNAILNSLHFEDSGWYFSSKVLKEFSLSNSILYGGNHFFATNFSILHQTVYFSMYLTLAILILIEFPFKDKRINWGIIVFLGITILCVLNRASYLILFVLMLYMTIKKIKSNYIKVSVLFGLVTALVSFGNVNPRVKRSIGNIKTFLKDDGKDEARRNELINNIDRRILLWNEASDLIKENFYFGLGLGDVEDELDSRFKEKGLTTLIGLNTHNQYLQTMLEVGLIGLLLLFTMFYFLFKNLSVTYTSILGVGFIILIGVNFMFESMFSRYSGLSFIIFFYCLFVFERVNTKPLLQKANFYNV